MENFNLKKFLTENILLEENETSTIELYQGTELNGPKETEAEAKKIAKEIEKEMRSVYKAAKGSGSESQAMDERDDVVYEFKDQLKKIKWEID